MHTLKALAESPKRIARFPGWTKPEPETNYVLFEADLEIGGVIQASFVLHGGGFIHMPDANVTFELKVSKRPGRRAIPLMRVDWKSLKGGHTNPRRGVPGCDGKRVGPTHLHPFDVNYVPMERRMRHWNLPYAQDVEAELKDFIALRDYVGEVFRIENIEVVAEPKWDLRLF